MDSDERRLLGGKLKSTLASAAVRDGLRSSHLALRVIQPGFTPYMGTASDICRLALCRYAALELCAREQERHTVGSDSRAARMAASGYS